MFFLSKTHLGKAKAETLKSRWGCDHYIIHESDGRSGGLLMLWRKEVVIQLNDVSKYFIDVVVRDGDEWRLTGVYGEPSWDHEDQTWGHYARYMVAVRSPGWPWVILTRFYFIMRRKGGEHALRDIYKRSKMLWQTVVLRTLVIPDTFSPGEGGKLENALIEAS